MEGPAAPQSAVGSSAGHRRVGFREGNAYLAQGPVCMCPMTHTGTCHPHSDDCLLKMHLLNNTDCELVELIFSGGGDCL